METVRGVLLDVDGTLIDSNDAHAGAWVDALAERGVRVQREAARRLIGMGGDKLLPRLAGIDGEGPEAEAIGARRGEIFRERYLPKLRAFPGARELVAHLRGRGLAVVVASSARRDELGALLAVAGVGDLLDDTTSSDDAARSKPDPDIVQAAVTRAGLDAGALVMLGDTPYDVEAATRAGVRVIAVRCGGWSDVDLRGAAAIYDGPADLLARYDRSLLGLNGG